MLDNTPNSSSWVSLLYNLYKCITLPYVSGFHLLLQIQAVRLCWNAGATIDLQKLEEKALLDLVSGIGCI